MDIHEFRDLFPILSTTVYGKRLVYFDNAATTQRPKSVIDRYTSLAFQENSNIHRAVHFLSSKATQAYENTRDTVRSFINAKDRSEIVFTSGTTNSINLVAYSFCEAFLKEGDEIIVSECEHHSNIVPWQIQCERKKANLKVLPVDDTGHLCIDMLSQLISSRTKILCITHISNVLGIINPIERIISIAHSKGVPVLIDGAQGIAHQRIDVQKLDCDFYCFSAHKMFGSTGTGVLFGKKEFLENMPPFMGGGEMIETVKFSGTTFAPLPEKFEAGTQNFNSVPTIDQAIGILNEIFDSQFIDYHNRVKEYFLQRLLSDDRVTLYGVPHGTEEKIALFSFTVKGIHHEDLALIMDKLGVALRSGQMCAEPLMDRYSVTGMLRASLTYYNTLEEVDIFFDSLSRAIRMLS